MTQNAFLTARNRYSSSSEKATAQARDEWPARKFLFQLARDKGFETVKALADHCVVRRKTMYGLLLERVTPTLETAVHFEANLGIPPRNWLR